MICAAKDYDKSLSREGRFLPSESQPSSYLVNKDILLGVIPAEQDGLLGGGFSEVLTSPKGFLAAHS